MTYNRVAKPVTIVTNHTFRFNELINQLSHHNLNRKSYTPEFTFGRDPKNYMKVSLQRHVGLT